MPNPTPYDQADDKQGNGCSCQKGNEMKGKGKPKTLGKTVWDMYGTKRGGVRFEEKLLWSPNSNSMASANF